MFGTPPAQRACVATKEPRVTNPGLHVLDVLELLRVRTFGTVTPNNLLTLFLSKNALVLASVRKGTPSTPDSFKNLCVGNDKNIK